MTRHDGMGSNDLHDLRSFAIAVLGIVVFGCMFIGVVVYEKAKEKIALWLERFNG